MVAENPLGHEQFRYDASPGLFGCRQGFGPLVLTLDTNLLIHLAENLDDVGGSFGIETAFDPAAWDDPVLALRDLFALWFWRDVRFFLPEAQMSDGQLSADRHSRRRSVLEAFATDFWVRGGSTRATTRHDPYEVDDEPLVPLVDQDALWPPSYRDALPRWRARPSARR